MFRILKELMCALCSGFLQVMFKCLIREKHKCFILRVNYKWDVSEMECWWRSWNRERRHKMLLCEKKLMLCEKDAPAREGFARALELCKWDSLFIFLFSRLFSSCLFISHLSFPLLHPLSGLPSPPLSVLSIQHRMQYKYMHIHPHVPICTHTYNLPTL